MNKQIIFSDLYEIEGYRERIINNSKMTTKTLQDLLSYTEGLDALKQMKFRRIGRDPFCGDDLNLIEQLNQTFTYLVCLEAVKYLIQENPGHRYLVNFGTQNGFDVSSLDSDVICECFSSTSPDSNNKLEKDVKWVSESEIGEKKYVIFYSEEIKESYVERVIRKYPDVKVVRLTTI